MLRTSKTSLTGIVSTLLLLLFVQVGFSQSAKNGQSAQHSKTVRLFIIGNSFSQNAARYLPQIAKEKNFNLEIGRAELGGCSLQRHWEIVEAAEANPEDPKGKQYKGKSLQLLLSDGKWDVVTIQQYSMLSGDPDSYRPYARKLYDFIKKLQPDAKIVIHQTWAYRSDATVFGQTGHDKRAKDHAEMHENVRAAYHTIANELGVDIIPTGDAFWAINSNPAIAYKKDSNYNFTNPVYPLLPDQNNSLHVGYYWNKDKKLSKDANHANAAGEYLGSLVWFKSLFGVSPRKVKFKPEEVSDDFAGHLKKAAALASAATISEAR